MRLIHVSIFFFLLNSLIGFSQRDNVSELTLSDNKYTLNGSPFNGKAYVLTAAGQLKEEFTLENGMMNGLYEFFKIDDRYDKSKFIDTISIAKKIKMIEEVKMDISKLQKDSIRNLDSIWILEEELFGGRIFKQLESIEVLKRKEKQKKLSEKYTDDKLNKKKEGFYNTYADVHKKFIDCNESLAAYRLKLKAHKEWIGNEKMKPSYKNILRETFTYARGVQTGTHVVYTKSGEKDVEETLDNGKKNGPYKRYSGSKIVEEGNYVNNEKEGVWTTLNSSEKITQNFSKGKLNGASKKYNNDVLVETGQFMNGLMTGVWKFYYLNGKIKGEGSFTNGDGGNSGKASGIPKNGREGSWILYHENGNKQQVCSYEKGGVQGAFFKYHANGKISHNLTYKNDTLNGDCFTFFENGVLECSEFYINGKRSGEFTRYYETGEISEQGIYVDGKFEGTYMYHLKNGNKCIGTMKNGTMDYIGSTSKVYAIDGSIFDAYYENGQWYKQKSTEQLNEEIDKFDTAVTCEWCNKSFKAIDGYMFRYAGSMECNREYDNSLKLKTVDVDDIYSKSFCSKKCAHNYCDAQ
jgi:antitoxin component YwqK of YwqJK toxin-antitoxin module